MSVLLLIMFLTLMLLGIPIAISLGISSIVTLAVFSDIPLSLVVQSMFTSMNSFIMVAVPLFILSGYLLDEGGVAEKIYNFANAMMGWMHGGLGNVAIFSSMLFAGMSGSSIADVASMGKISINAMKRHGYPAEYATSLCLSSSMLASIIPPSILMLVASSVANVSIGQALFAGIIPGVIIGLVFMSYNYLYCRKNKIGHKIEFSFHNLIKQFLKAIPALLVPLIILGGMFTGFVTPTEAAGIAVLYAILISLFLYKHITVNQLPSIFLRTAKTTGTILFIAVTAKPASWILEYDGLPAKIASTISGITTNSFLIMLVIFAFLILVGMFMDATAAIYIVVPILLPTVVAVGVDPVFFVVFLVITLTFGLITPPVGVCLYAASNVTGLKIETIVRHSLPWIAITVVTILIFIIFPQIISAPLAWIFK